MLVRHERQIDAGGDQWLQLLSSSLSDVETQLAAALLRVDEFHAISAAIASERDVVWDVGSVASGVHVLAAMDALPVLVASLDAEAQAAFADVIARGMALRSSLLDPMTAFVLVTSTGRGELGRLRRALAQFALLGLGVDVVVVNRVPRRRDDWPTSWAKRRRRRSRALVRMAQRAGAMPVRIPWLPTEMIGRRRLARELTPLDRMTRAPRTMSELTHADGDGYVWRIPVGLAHADELRFGRVGGDAVVVLDGMTRIIPLPSVVARCRLDAVALRDGHLVVSASPDPAVWPRP